MTNEQRAQEIRARHKLSSLHLFTSGIDNLEWRVFASRLEPKGFEASVESGGGMTIEEALTTLDARLIAGPINKSHIPILDAPPKAANS